MLDLFIFLVLLIKLANLYREREILKQKIGLKNYDFILNLNNQVGLNTFSFYLRKVINNVGRIKTYTKNFINYAGFQTSPKDSQINS